MTEQILQLDRIDFHLHRYVGLCSRVHWWEAVVVVLSLALSAASRTPSWKLTGSYDVIGDVSHVGYVMVFGPLVLICMLCGFYDAVQQSEACRRSILEDLGAKATNSDRQLLTSLSSVAIQDFGTINRAFAVIRPIAAVSVACLSYLILFAGYLECRRPGFQGNSLLDLFFGIGGWSGFKAEWHRSGANGMPWIYPPFQTWAYLAGFVLALLIAIECHRIGRRQNGAILIGRA